MAAPRLHPEVQALRGHISDTMGKPWENGGLMVVFHGILWDSIGENGGFPWDLMGCNGV